MENFRWFFGRSLKLFAWRLTICFVDQLGSDLDVAHRTPLLVHVFVVSQPVEQTVVVEDVLAWSLSNHRR